MIVGAGIPDKNFSVNHQLCLIKNNSPLALQVRIQPVSFKNITKLGGSTKNSGPRFSN